MSRTALFFAPFILMLAGCQQAAWKAGASADDLKRDELACRERGDEAVIVQCLRDKGWYLAEFQSANNDEDVIENGSNNSTPLTEPVRDQQNASPTSQVITNPQSPAKNTEKPTTNNDPLQKQSVQTWWKAGAHAADFQIDADRCLAQLGEQHIPDYSKRLYTRATINCLRERGWYAGSGPVYTPLR